MLGRPADLRARLGLLGVSLVGPLVACRPLWSAPPSTPARTQPPVTSAEPTPAGRGPAARYEHPRVDPDQPFDHDYRVEPGDHAQQLALAIVRDCIRHDPPGRWVDAVLDVDHDRGTFEVGEFVDPDLDPAGRGIPGSLYACFAAGAADRMPEHAAFSGHVELRALRVEPLDPPDPSDPPDPPGPSDPPGPPPPLPEVDEIPRSFEFTAPHFSSLARRVIGLIHGCAEQVGLAEDLELHLTFGWEDKRAIASASQAPAALRACLDGAMATEVAPYLAARYRRDAPSTTQEVRYRVTAADAFYVRPVATRAEIVRRIAQHLRDAFEACHLDERPPRHTIYVAAHEGAEHHFRWSAERARQRRADADDLSCVEARTHGDRLDRLFPDLSPPAGRLRLEVQLDPARSPMAARPPARLR